MAHPSETGTVIRPAPLLVERTFPARRELVFKAWSSADHIKQWFCPEGMTVPEAEVDFRAGGVFAVCMRSPEGQDFWSRGNFIEVTPPSRLVFASAVSIDGAVKFSAQSTVTFTAVANGTRMSVRQDYEIYDEAFLHAVDGAQEGWRTTLDRLGREVSRIVAEDTPAAHAMFTLERTYPSSPARVFRAFTDPAAKAKWFAGGDGYTVLARRMDVRVGGQEHASGRWTNGTVSRFDAIYHDIVPERRLVYSYVMHLDDRKISVSLATIEIQPVAGGTRLVVTEQGVFLNGYQDGGAREQGTNFLIDRLGASLAEP